MNKHSVFVVFDLDDTLYKEIDFLESAYCEIAGIIGEKLKVDSSFIYEDMKNWYYEGSNAFNNLLKKYKPSDVSLNDLISLYRNHIPEIALPDESREVLTMLKKQNIPMGIMTDGRSVQQRNKIKALGLENFTEFILISEEFGSEKPDIRNYKYFMENYPSSKYFYIGDNTAKDFISARKLGWTTICLLDSGKNIHKQNFNLPEAYLPNYKVKNIAEVLRHLFS